MSPYLVCFLLAAPNVVLADDATDLDALRNEVARVRAIVSEIRGLEWKRDVSVQIERDRPPNSRYSGYYRHGSDTITIVDPSRIGLDLLIAHELTHALQDQHFGLDRTEQGVRGEDARLAFRAAVEGEAHLVAASYALRRFKLDGRFSAEQIPLVRPLGYAFESVQRCLRRVRSGTEVPPPRQDAFLFPYIDGLVFVQAVVRARGQGLHGLDGVLLDPPRSTEQVLHPEKYLAERRDDPIRVAVPRPEGGGHYRLVRSGTLGEWRLRARLEERLPGRRAGAAAAGWGGDAHAEYEDAGRKVEMLATEWDTEADAAEFASAYRAYIEAGKEVADIQLAGNRVTISTHPREPRLF